MTTGVPDEMVQAAAEAVLARLNETGKLDYTEWSYMVASTALQAAFAKLPASMKAEVTGNDDDRRRAEGWNECLLALANMAKATP